MAEATITDLILTVREENEKSRDETKKNTSQIITLNKTFSDYFTMLKRQALDAEESRRDTKAASGAGAGATAAITPPDKEGGGFLGILAGILVAGGALILGIVEGFTNAAKLILRQFGRLIRPFTSRVNARFSKMFIGMTDSITDFIRLFRSNFSIGLGKQGKFIKDFGKVRALRVKDFSTFAGRLGAFTARINRMFIAIGGFFGKGIFVAKLFGLVGREIVKSIPLAPEVKTFGKDIAFLGNKLKGLFKVGKEVPKQAGVISRFFTSLGQTFRALITPLKGIFTVFRTIGRVVFFPLTIIMGIFDGIRGAMAGYQDEGILGGILGAVGGIFGGLIGMPLDLLKSAVAWIAGKMGFENVEETLKSFSFKDMFLNLFIGIAGMINTFIDNITSAFQDGIGSGLSMVLTYLKRMLLFPAAVAAGGVAALAAALPGGKSPSEAFSDAFNATFKLGEGSVLPSPSSNTSGSEISAQVNDNAETQNGFLAGQSSTQVIDTSQQNNVNITQTHDVAATDDTDKKPS
jgi:hypothetical protein